MQDFASEYVKSTKKPDEDVSELLQKLRGGIFEQESSGNYKVTPNRRTQATGGFQVLPDNIPAWTQKHYGKRLNRTEFENNIEAQEAVFSGEMGRYLKKAKQQAPDDETAMRMAAAAWYGGEGRMHKYDDPKRFRPDEPSFREYTTSVVKKAGAATPKFKSFADAYVKSNPRSPSQPTSTPSSFADSYVAANKIPQTPLDVGVSATPDIAQAIAPIAEAADTPAGRILTNTTIEEAAKDAQQWLAGAQPTVPQPAQPNPPVDIQQEYNDWLASSNKPNSQASVDEFNAQIRETGKHARTMDQLGRIGESSAKGELAPDAAYLDFIEKSGLPDDNDSVALFNADVQKRNAAMQAKSQADFEKHPSYAAYQKFLADTGLKDSPETIQEFNTVQQTLNKEGVPTQESAEKWLAEKPSQAQISALTQKYAKPSNKDKVEKPRAIGKATDSEDVIDYSVTVDPKWSDEKKLRHALSQKFTPQEVDSYISKYGALGIHNPKANKFGVPRWVTTTLRGGDVSLTETRTEQAEAQLDRGVPTEMPGRIKDTEAKAQIEAGIRQDEQDKRSLSVKMLFSEALKNPITGAIDLYDQLTKEPNYKKEIDDAVAQRLKETEAKHGSYSNAVGRSKQFEGMGLGKLTPTLTEFAKGAFVDNFAPMLESGGIVQNAFQRYVQGKDTQAKDTDLYKSAQAMRETFEKGLPDAEQALGSSIGLERPLGQVFGTLLMTAGGMNGLKLFNAPVSTTKASLAIGGLTGIEQQASEAYRKAIQSGATEDQANLAALLSAPGGALEGASEALILSRLSKIQKLDKATGGIFSSEILAKLKTAGKEFVKGGATEWLLEEVPQQLVSSTAARLAYKKDGVSFKGFLKDFDDAIKDSAITFLVGGIMGGGSTLLQETENAPKQEDQLEPLSQIKSQVESKPLAADSQLEGSDGSALLNQLSSPKRGLNVASAGADNLANLVKTDAFRKQGLRGFDAETQRMVVASVLDGINDLKIRDGIVKSIPVDVMDVLVSSELPPKVAFHDQTVLKDGAAVNLQDPVAGRLVDATDTLMRVLAGQATESRPSSLGEPSGLDTKLDPTVSTVGQQGGRVAVARTKATLSKSELGGGAIKDNSTSLASDFHGDSLPQNNAKPKENNAKPLTLAQRRTRFQVEAPIRPEVKEGRVVGGGEVTREGQEREIERRRADDATVKANTNPLTGLGSKHAWEAAKDRIETDPEQEIVSLDLNHMKNANDTTSHDMVDKKVLAPLGKVIADVLEKNGIDTRNAFTPGGDEAYISVPKGQAEKIRNEIESAFGTIELEAQKDYTNERTGETFKKGDKIPVTISGAFGATLNDAEAGLQERKAAKKAEKVEPTEESDSFGTFKRYNDAIDPTGNWKRFDAIPNNQKVALYHATSREAAESMAREGYKAQQSGFTNTPPDYVYLGSRHGLGTYEGSQGKGDPVFVVFTATKGDVEPDAGTDWKSHIKKPSDRAFVVQHHGKEALRRPTATATLANIGQVRVHQTKAVPIGYIDPKQGDKFLSFSTSSEADAPAPKPTTLAQRRKDKSQEAVAIEAKPKRTTLAQRRAEKAAKSKTVETDTDETLRSVPTDDKVSGVVDTFLYHGTGEGAFRRIREEGLLPVKSNAGGYVYFADKETYADTYAERKGAPFGNRVLRVKKTSAFVLDDRTKGGDFKIAEPIPPDNIEVRVGGEWVPIREYANEEIGLEPLRKARDEDSYTLLTQQLPNAQDQDVIEGITSKMDGNDLELNEYASEAIRRLMGERSSTDEAEFAGIVLNNKELRGTIEVGRELSDGLLKAGFTERQLKPLNDLLDNLDKLADINKDYSVMFVFDDARAEELVHQEDLRAGRTTVAALAKLKESPFWKNVGPKFRSQYPRISEANKASEIAAKLATDQAETYGWDKIDDFENEKAKFLTTWADGIVDNNRELIESEGIEAFKQRFVRISQYASDQSNTAESATSERATSAREPDRTVGQEEGAKEPEKEDTVREAEASGVTEAEVVYKNRKHAETLRKHGLDVEDVPYIPETERGWQEKGREIVEKSLADKGDYSAAIKEFNNPKNISGGERTALGYELIDRLGAEGDYAQMREIADGVVVHEGQAGAILRAAQLVGKYDFAKAVDIATRAVQKNGKTLTDKEISALRKETAKYAQTEEELATAIHLFEEAKAENERIQAEIDEIEKALVEADKKRTIDEKLIKALRRQVSYWKNKKVAESRPRRSAAYKDLLDKKQATLDKIRETFGEDVTLKSVATDTDSFKKWFGDSKVVDENGDPLVVYHGTFKDFDSFEPRSEGIFFTPHPEVASGYASFADENSNDGSKGNVRPVYLSLNNPYVKDFKGEESYDFFDESEAAREGGHDGMILLNVKDSSMRETETQYVVFNPEQIKSAIGNRGTFDPNDDSILRSVAKGLDEDTRNALVDYTARLIFESTPYEALITNLKETTGLSDAEIGAIHADAVDSMKGTGKQSDKVKDALRIRHEHKKEARRFRDGGLDLNRLDREILKDVKDAKVVFATLLWNRALNPEDFKAQMKKEFPDMANKEVDELLKDVGQRREKARASLRRQAVEKKAGKKLSDAEVRKAEVDKRTKQSNVRKSRQSLDRRFRHLGRSVRTKVAEGIMEGINFLKGTAATGEISYLLRQGLLPLVTETRAAIKGDWEGVGHGLQGDNELVKKAAKTLGYENVADYLTEHSTNQFIEKVREHPKLQEAQAVGIRFTEIGDHNIADEHFSSSVLKAIPLYKRLETAYTLPGDLQRLYIYDAWSNVIEGQGLTTHEEVQAKKYAAKVINALTGKGDIGSVLAKGGWLSKLANTAFFSPSLLVSRFQSTYHLTTGFATAPKGMRMQMAKKGLRVYTVLGLIAYLLGMNFDPDDEDFGKIRPRKGSPLAKVLGEDVQLNPLAGMDLPQQLLWRNAAGMFRAIQTGDSGHLTDSISETWQQLATNKRNEPRFLRGKLSPTASWAADYYTGTDYIGRPYTHWGSATSRLVPMSWGQVYDALLYDRHEAMMKEPVTMDRAKQRFNDNERDFANALSIMIPTFIGIGVNQYPSHEATPATKKAGQIADYVSDKSSEQIRIEGGLRSLIKEKMDLEKAGEDTTKVSAAIARYAAKYKQPLGDLTSQARSETGLLGFYVKDLSVAQLKRILPLANEVERPVIEKALRKKQKIVD